MNGIMMIADRPVHWRCYSTLVHIVVAGWWSYISLSHTMMSVSTRFASLSHHRFLFLPSFLPSFLFFFFTLFQAQFHTTVLPLLSLFHVFFFFAVLTPYFIINMNNPTEMVRFDLLSLFFPPLWFFVLFVRLFTCFVSVILTLSFKKLKTVI